MHALIYLNSIAFIHHIMTQLKQDHAYYYRGGEHGGAEGAIAPPCFKVEGQCPPTFPYLTLLLSTNIIHLHLLQVIQLLEVGLLQSMYYHHYNSRSYALIY